MLNLFKKILGIKSLEEKAEEYVKLQEQSQILKSEISDLADSYLIQTNYFNKSLSEPANQSVQKQIQSKYNQYLVDHVYDVRNIKEKYDKLNFEIDKLEKSDDRFLDAVQKLKEIKAYEIIKGKYKSNILPLSNFNDIIKAKKGKVNYADMIVYDNSGRLLLLLRSNDSDFAPNTWSLPGGHVDLGEDFDTAAKRELQEETGLEVKKCEKVGEYSDKDSIIEYHQVNLEDKENSEVILESSEHQSYKWILLSEFLEDEEMEGIMNLKDNLKKIYLPIERNIEIIKKAIQDGKISEKYLEKLKSLKKSTEDKISGGLAGKKTVKDLEKKYKLTSDEAKRKLIQGAKVESEHTDDKKIAVEIAMDHLWEDKDYYDKLATIEKAFKQGKISEELFEKAKYIRREGTPGNYKYIYKESNDKEAKTDKSGNIVGDGTSHVDYNVLDLKEYPQISSTVNKSQSTETVYVKYYNKENNKNVTLRFSWHENNAVKLGDQLNGNIATKDEVLYKLGLKNREFVPNKKLSILYTSIKKKRVGDYEEADKTLQELYDLGSGADISKYKGKVAKGSNILIQGDTVNEVEEFKNNYFGQPVKIGKFIYSDITKSKDKFLNIIKKALEEGRLSSKIKEQLFEKARKGVYADNAQNRKLKRVGKPYGSSGGVTPDEDKKSVKQDENGEKQGSDKPLDDHAKEASGSALEVAAKEATDPEVRVAANKELDRREKEEKVSEKEEESKPSQEKDEKSTEKESSSEKSTKEPETKEEEPSKIDYNKELEDIKTQIMDKRKLLSGSDDLDEINRVSGEITELGKKFSSLKREQSSSELGVSKEEVQSIFDYTTSSYREINKSLREGKLSTEQQDKVNKIDNTLSKLPEFKGKVYRGMSIPEDINSMMEEWKKGGIINMKSFTSTSTDKDISSNFGDFKIEIESKSGRDISKLSDVQGENEILFKTGAKFKVQSIKVKKYKHPLLGDQILSVDVKLSEI